MSFVPETEAGEAPALLSFHNTTAGKVSIWLNEVAFDQVQPGLSLGPSATASADVKKETVVGQHRDDSSLCVNFPLGAYLGPAALAPGASYVMSLDYLGRAEGYQATVTATEAAEPFLALRGELHDATASAEPSSLLIELVGEAEALTLESYDASRSAYVFARTSNRTVSRVTFVDRSGARYVSSQTMTLGDAPGYTAVVDDKPSVGAVAVEPLVPAAQ